MAQSCARANGGASGPGSSHSDSDAVLMEVHRVVRPGGTVAFLEPSAVTGWERLRTVSRCYDGGFRFGMSMLLWSVASRLHGRYTTQTLSSQLVRCGFSDPHVVPAFAGLGLLATAVRS